MRLYWAARLASTSSTPPRYWAPHLTAHTSVGASSADLPQRRLCLGEPERHGHGTIEFDGRGKGGAPLFPPTGLHIQGAEATVAVGLEWPHAEILGQRQRIPIARLGLRDIWWAGLGMDGIELEQRVRLFSTRLQLSGPVERLTGVLPGLVNASGMKIDRAELAEVGGITAARSACTEVIPVRLLCQGARGGGRARRGPVRSS
jgi:hypothetical protein